MSSGRSWSKIIFFKTNCQVTQGEIEKVVLHIKFPRSDFRQKIKLIDSDPKPLERKLVGRGSYELFTYELTSALSNMEIISRFNVEITKKNYPVSKSPFPPRIDDEKSAFYLQPTSLIESNASEIQELGENLTGLAKLLVGAVLRIIRWINSYVKYDPSYLENRQSALETLKTKKGTCEDINHLFNAICRAIKIPARISMGFSKGASGWERHVWSEIFDPQFGWFPVDVLYKPVQVGHLGSTHLKRMTSLDCGAPEFRVEYEYPLDAEVPVLTVSHSLFIDRSVIPATVQINPKKENVESQ